jgi:Chalcone isomerase-like
MRLAEKKDIHMQRRTLAASMMFGALAPGLAWSQPQPAPVAPAAPAAPVDVAGVKFDRTVRVGAHTLKLNGAGIRWKAVFKVYAAALYLAAPADTPEAVLGSTGAKRIHLVALRTIEANELGKAFTDAIEKNASRDEFIRSLQPIIEMGQVTAAYRSLNHGDSIVFDWVPGTGTTMFVKGKAEMGPVADPAFFAAMTKIWLGTRPADAQLKDALLGRQVEQEQNRGA